MHIENTQNYMQNLFQFIGEDSNREGLVKTPERVAKLHETLYSGYAIDPNTILDSVFSDGACNEMVVVRDIEFYSMCEHHLLPFFGKISIGYIPDKKVVGISNLSKLVEVFARRLQIQEKLTTQIADTIMHSLKPKGAMVVCEALHLCMAMRGNAKQNSKILTSAVRGLFQQDSRTRMEFMQLIKT
ncbi:GTP cyclohydrolase I FolE [Helicobacter trogontum]|nr:GTP cyclohydrolase I FolE [Helicobacter trogontum]